ncbi:MAG TPA: hypothetical protein VHL31_18705 [Geminicoccus sp.]|uniref:hypothetical protein n=1 Tax=Geminicoccus sp. TaxID=2024832 RepID=UPI002E3114EA|nr:hypothetical protein [Geminicoccus sp.]HEX2528317.1 hypothetical protein [Geminicoccus sp.]
MAHVIARALDVSTRSHQHRIPVAQRYDLAEQIADSIELLGWQVLRPHRDPARRDGS